MGAIRVNIGTHHNEIRDSFVLQTQTASVNNVAESDPVESIQSPVGWLTEKVSENIMERLTESVTTLATNFIEVLPIVFGISFGVYALLNMVSKTLANWGVFLVVGYSVLILLFG